MGDYDDPDGLPSDDPFARAIGEGVIDAVVKVFCTHTEPNWSLPWQRKRQMASTSSGFIIPGASWERGAIIIAPAPPVDMPPVGGSALPSGGAIRKAASGKGRRRFSLCDLRARRSTPELRPTHPLTPTYTHPPGRRVLTNAHSVDFHTTVKLKHRGNDTKFIARVLSVGPECAPSFFFPFFFFSYPRSPWLCPHLAEDSTSVSG